MCIPELDPFREELLQEAHRPRFTIHAGDTRYTESGGVPIGGTIWGKTL